MFRYLPEQASEHAPQIDWLHNLITDLSVFFTVAIVGSMLYFAIRYRRGAGGDHETPQIRGSHLLEMIWTVVPTIISIFIAYEGIRVFRVMREVPKDAIVVHVTGSQWKWDFKYDETGKSTTNNYVLPVNTPVKMVLTSTDVLHSFFVPEMRVKSDAIKGQYTYVTFKPTKTGTFRTFCTEYCGRDHSAMMANLTVVSEEDYKRWVHDTTEKEVPPVDRGARLYSEKACKSCHSLDGSKVVGPTWLKLYGSARKFADGSTATADDNYLRESILKPNTHIVEGFAPNLMPVFEGQLSEEDIVGLIAFIKSVDGSAPAAAAKPVSAAAVDTSKMSPEERGKLIYEHGKGAAAQCSACHTIDGSKLVGPSLKGLIGRQAKWSDGTAYTATEEYIHESIVEPNKHIVEGYAPGMPAVYKDSLTENDIKDIIAFIKSLH